MAEDSERPSKRVKLEDNVEDEQTRREIQAGINQYVGDAAGWTGVLKMRYTDFLVNEITLSQEVLHLTSTQAPVPVTDKATDESASARELEQERAVTEVPGDASTNNGDVARPSGGSANASLDYDEPKISGSEQDQSKVEEQSDPAKIPQQDVEILEGLFGDLCVPSLLKLYREVLKRPERKTKDFRTISTWPIDDKMKRGEAHQAIRRIFKGTLSSTHAEKNQLIISKTSKGGRGPDGTQWSRSAGSDKARGKLGWDELGGQYLHFNLHKENRDTMEVISFIGSQLKCAPKNFAFAGTKDRRAVTVQRVSLYRQHAWQLARINRMFKEGSRLGNFEYRQKGLELGALWGNEFVITLRDCHFIGEEGKTIDERAQLAQEMVGRSVSQLLSNGFINYYGLQRFGSFTAGTDEIGVKLLQGDFEGAINLILHFHPSALEEAQKEESTAKISSNDLDRALAIHIWRETGDVQKALEKMPRKFSVETNIIRHLGHEKHGKKTRDRDFQGALRGIQRNMRLMYVHAYQSLVWNTVAGRRWELHGGQVVEGDLVIVGENAETAADLPDVDDDGEPIVRPAVEDSAELDGDFERARPLTKAEAESGKYTIFDIVLPLPGWDVVYPKNSIGEYYKEFMKSKRGGGLDPYNMRRPQKEFSLSGGYRKILSKPAPGMTFGVKSYKDEIEQLVETDLDRLEKRRKQSSGTPMDVDNKDPKYIAIILKMQLGSSQYATMALRELLKAGGVKSYQADFSGRG